MESASWFGGAGGGEHRGTFGTLSLGPFVGPFLEIFRLVSILFTLLFLSTESFMDSESEL